MKTKKEDASALTSSSFEENNYLCCINVFGWLQPAEYIYAIREVMVYDLKKKPVLTARKSEKAVLILLIKDWLSSFFSLLFPRCCIVCSRPLAKGEECICTVCNIKLPRTNLHLRKDNPIERLFWGQIPLERATSFFFYEKESDFRLIIHRLKYGGQKETGAIMGRYMAAELLSSDFFQGIDVIIPVPLHKKKQQIRGYNQSEWIARGIAAITDIPIDTESILRKKNTETQTRKSVFERRDNVEGIFELQHPEPLAGKHILIVDDVLTTGSTILACASCLVNVKGIRISILTLAAVE